MYASQFRSAECAEPWFTHIREGRKTVEGRKAGGSWRDVQAGETIVINKKERGAIVDSFSVRVVSVARYEAGPGALRRFLEGETLGRTLPGIATLEEGEKVYAGLPGWTADSIERHGMLGIRVQVLHERMDVGENSRGAGLGILPPCST